jgi:hypothetical protein
MRLTDDELRDVLARAEEIQRTSRHGEAWNAEVRAVIGAAEEVGLSRDAVERALEERYHLSPTVVGGLVWARSSDKKFYVAEVLSVHEGGAVVRFLRGTEHRVSDDQLRPCGFLPGDRIVCNWPWWGPWTCTVIAYDPTYGSVKVHDGWGMTETFPVSEVWLAPPQERPRPVRLRTSLALMGGGAAVGALIGSLLTALLVR